MEEKIRTDVYIAFLRILEKYTNFHKSGALTACKVEWSVDEIMRIVDEYVEVFGLKKEEDR